MKVALRKESVDRNAIVNTVIFCITGVALRKESVDRNQERVQALSQSSASLSARRAWIEIIDYIVEYATDAMSLSARRAWIEI